MGWDGMGRWRRYSLCGNIRLRYVIFFVRVSLSVFLSVCPLIPCSALYAKRLCASTMNIGRGKVKDRSRGFGDLEFRIWFITKVLGRL